MGKSGECWGAECTKIAHRRSLAIFAADEGIAGNSAARAIFTHFIRRRNRGSLAIFFAEEIAHLGASKNRAIFWGAVKIAAAAAENRAILVHSVGGKTFQILPVRKALETSGRISEQIQREFQKLRFKFRIFFRKLRSAEGDANILDWTCCDLQHFRCFVSALEPTIEVT